VPFLKDMQLKADVQYIFKQKISVVKPYPEHSVSYQFVPPPMQLVLIGAGNDAQPIVDMASLLGWNIIVVDGRPSYATQERFPKANKVCVSKPQDLLSAIKIDEQTALVLMTHNYNYDLAALEQIINTPCNYIGLLGPKTKLNEMLGALKEKGLDINNEMKNSIYGPVGLDIGAETAEEIALSIIAEIKAVFSNRKGTFLKERPLEIHERS
jgi:xanthine/CO dehydrogenase XdhC/CoxF family maturation factor